MTTTLKKTQLVVPPSIQKRAGIVITIVSKLPSEKDEYTPQQRRAIDARLAEANKGLYHGPFKTADAAIKFLNKEISKRKSNGKVS